MYRHKFTVIADSIGSMEKVISFNNCNYHLFALWNRYYSNSDVEIFFTDESLNGYIVANTPSSLDDKSLI